MKRRGRKKDLKIEIDFYKGILEDKPDFVEALYALGDAYTRAGFYKEGLEVDKKLSQMRPQDPVVFYNLACSYSLVGDLDQALKSLKKAIVLGYADFSYMDNDPDLENLRRDPRYKELRERIVRILRDH